jgi:hypothetical protein
MSVSFVPDACNALAMQACLQARACKLLGKDIPGINETFGSVTELFAGADISLDAKHLCLKAAFEAAFNTAGCPFPPEPPRPDPPDFSECQAIIADIAAQQADPLRLVSSVMTITLDSQLLPILITVP